MEKHISNSKEKSHEEKDMLPADGDLFNICFFTLKCISN